MKKGVPFHVLTRERCFLKTVVKSLFRVFYLSPKYKNTKLIAVLAVFTACACFSYSLEIFTYNFTRFRNSHQRSEQVSRN